MKKRLFFGMLVFSLVLGVLIPSKQASVLAYNNGKNKNKTVVVVLDDTMSIEKQRNLIDAQLNDPDVETVDVISTDVASDIDTSADIPSSRGVLVSDHKISNVQKKANSAGSNVLSADEGPPGLVLSISHAYTITHTFSATFGATVAKINSALSWGTSLSETRTVTGTFAVPSTENGKKVKKATLTAYPLYEVKTYDVSTKIAGLSQPWKYSGTGTAKRFIGASFTKTFVYENQTAIATVVPKPTLRKGSTGAQVKLLQKFLGVTQDGIFGAKTETALKNFQKKYGLSVDGIYGAKSEAKFKTVFAGSNIA